MIEFCTFLIIMAVLAVVASLMTLILIFTGDRNLSLMYYEKFGRPVDKLAGQSVWITGASSGIGRALAIELASVGCKLVLSARRAQELSAVKEECLKFGKLRDSDVLVLPMDVTDYSKHQDWFNQVVEQFGRINVLVLNAGRSQRANWEDIDIAVDKELFDLNFFSQVALTTHVLKHFLKNGGGQIAVTSSVAGKLGVPLSRSYNGSKHALHGYFETLRVEHSINNVSINMLCPGPIFTDFLSVAFTDKTGEVVGIKTTKIGNRMTAKRCARLSAVAIVNNLDEAWIANPPFLIFLYASQYFPTIFRRILSKVAMKQVMKIRDSGKSQQSSALPKNN